MSDCGWKRNVSWLAVAVCSLTAMQAMAQVPAVERGAGSANGATAGGGDGEDIVVSGSRVARTGFNAPTPTTVIGEELIEARGFTNAIDAINEVPAFRPSQTPAAGARGGISSGGSFVDLRGLSAAGGAPTARTLVLVDRRRFVPSNQVGQVDLNLIPTALIARTEVVTGGASAAWGSDAVAGVVNIILKKDLQGIEASAGYGQTDKDDYHEYSFNFAAGTGFADGRGHVLFGVDYFDNRGIPDPAISRDWGRRGYGNLALGPRPAGTPARNILPDVRLSDRLAPGGVIVGGPLDNIEFLGNGATRIFTPGTLVGGNQMFGGGANDSNAGIYFTGGSNLVNPIKRFATMGRLTYDISDALTGFVELSYGESHFRGLSASHRDDANLTIRQDNAFLPESVRAQMVARNLQTITVGRIALDDNFNYYRLRTDQNVRRVAAGLKGELGGFEWDAYYQNGRSRYVQRNQSTVMSNYLAAVDAVRDASGTIVCRPGAANNPDPGCVPFNIFGRNSPSQGAVDYVQRTSRNAVTTRQEVAALNITGEPLTLWAGPVSVALGVEYRRERVNSVVDAASAARRYDVSNYQPIRGSYHTKEAYGEIVVPLLKDSPAGRSLEFNGALRRTDYSTSGAVTTWKIGGTYDPVDTVRFRATLSRDIRAPNLNELFAGAVSGRANVVDPATGVSRQTTSLVVGNARLRPERARTFTGGVVFSPSFVPGFRASADYFDIRIRDVITQFSAQTIVDRCAAGATELCRLITRNAANAIVEVRGETLNFNALETRGVDLEASYSIPADTLVPGQFTLRALATYVDRLVLTDAVGPTDRVRQTVPHWSANATLTYSLGRFIGTAQVRYIDSTLFDATLIGPDDPRYDPKLPNSINVNRRPPVAYVNLSAQYRIAGDEDRGVQLFGVINNLFDKDPPPFAGSNPTGGVLYDLIGRSFRFGIRGKY